LGGPTAHNPLLRLVLTLSGRPAPDISDGYPKCEIPPGFPVRSTPACAVEPMMKQGVWMLATIPAVVAGWTDWRSRRIPNWLTVPALFLGIGVNTLALGWAGAKDSLLGAGLGLGLLLPFVLLRSLGGGDWKLVGALGAFLGPTRLIAVLVVTVLAAGVMAVILIVWKRRIGQTARNLLHMLASMFTLHLPGPDLSLDNPDSLKVPFGVAVAVAVVLYTVRQAWGF
jgi:prepilin peptidase CpaA